MIEPGTPEYAAAQRRIVERAKNTPIVIKELRDPSGTPAPRRQRVTLPPLRDNGPAREAAVARLIQALSSQPIVIKELREPGA